MGKDIKDPLRQSTKDPMDNIKNKRKAKDGDGQQTIAIEDTMKRNKTLVTPLAKPSHKFPTKSKVKENGRIMAKENHAVTKEKERDEAKVNRDSEMKERKNPK